MKKIILFLIILIIPLKIEALNYPNLHYESALIYDMTDEQVLYELNPQEQRSIASLTKVVTTITALELIDDLDETVTITYDMLSKVRWDASIAGLKVGDKVTYEDLLYASILPSGADATISIAISTTGSIDKFVEEMNKLTDRIGMTNSNFVNVHGLDEKGHYSTAEDIQKLLLYSLKNEQFKKIYTTKKFQLSTGKTVKSTVLKTGEKINTNTSRILGSKTGFTSKAGLCMSAIVKRLDHDILIITLGATPNKGNTYHILDTLELIKFIDNNYKYEQLVEKNKVIKKLPVVNSKIDSYTIKTNTNILKFLPRDYNKDLVEIKYTGLNYLSFKNKPKEKIGTIEYIYNNEVIITEDVILNKEIEISYIKIFDKHKFEFIAIIVFSILVLYWKRQILKKRRVLRN